MLNEIGKKIIKQVILPTYMQITLSINVSNVQLNPFSDFRNSDVKNNFSCCEKYRLCQQ